MKTNSLKIDNPMQVIMGVGQYNIFNILSELKKSKPAIEAHFKGHSIEGLKYDPDDPDDPDVPSWMAAWGVAFTLILVVIALTLWIWALVVTIKYFSIVPVWAQILAVLGLLGFGGPILTLIVIYIGKGIPTKSSRMYGGRKISAYSNSAMGKRSMFLG